MRKKLITKKTLRFKTLGSFSRYWAILTTAMTFLKKGSRCLKFKFAPLWCGKQDLNLHELASTST